MSYESELLPTDPTPQEMVELNDASLIESRAETLRCLRVDGITLVEAEYSGSGDSGQIDEIMLYASGTGEGPARIKSFSSFNGRDRDEYDLENFFYALLEEYGLNGFDNNGSAGTIKWDVTRDLIFMHHGWVVESYEDDSHIVGPGPTPDAA